MFITNDRQYFCYHYMNDEVEWAVCEIIQKGQHSSTPKSQSVPTCNMTQALTEIGPYGIIWLHTYFAMLMYIMTFPITLLQRCERNITRHVQYHLLHLGPSHVIRMAPAQTGSSKGWQQRWHPKLCFSFVHSSILVLHSNHTRQIKGL